MKPFKFQKSLLLFALILLESCSNDLLSRKQLSKEVAKFHIAMHETKIVQKIKANFILDKRNMEMYVIVDKASITFNNDLFLCSDKYCSLFFDIKKMGVINPKKKKNSVFDFHNIDTIHDHEIILSNFKKSEKNMYYKIGFKGIPAMLFYAYCELNKNPNVFCKKKDNEYECNAEVETLKI